MSHSRILVAEDDPGVRELIRARLSAAGYDTHEAFMDLGCGISTACR